jgi:hypothetical protein
MGELTIPIIGGDQVLSNADYADAIPINMLAVIRDIKGNPGYLISHDGLTQTHTGHGIDRGALFNERWGRSFRVSGGKLIEIVGATVVVIGDIAGSGRVRMAYGFNSIMIVASGITYRYDGTTLTMMTDPDFGAPIDVIWLDQYYIFTDGEYLYHTDIVDETSISPLKFATSELSPDKTKAVGRTQDNLLIAINRYTTEYFIDQANDNFAFTRINQKAVNCGIVSAGGWIEIGGRVYMLGGAKGEPVTFKLLGAGQAETVATDYIERIINNYSESELFAAYLEGRSRARDQLVYIQLPNHTLLYNVFIANKFGPQYAWSELRSGEDAWRACNGVYDTNLGQWIFGDKLVATIGKLDDTLASHYGESVTSQFQTALIPMESVSVSELELNVVSGYGEDTALFVSTTQNGSYHGAEWTKYIAMALMYNYRYIVRRVGYVRKQIGFKFRSLNKSKINVSGLKVTHDGG